MTDTPHHFSQRRLNDNVSIQTQNCGLPGWIHVNIVSPGGHYLATFMCTYEEAFTEIPYQLDRAREFDRLYGERQKVQERNAAIDAADEDD